MYALYIDSFIHHDDRLGGGTENGIVLEYEGGVVYINEVEDLTR